ncbi:transcriptional regulator, TetR family [Malonomonas rubra DSM 5091]|uniref:Transcriptional regulator, TetR family n=1 Tax=Malonomonas rubra DSM 5091 TaxID=1122189 RepID=A0A1M6HE30_MALRU|nr:TetR/AcrR family transcriptional regulator [Malonomonas rubra]SHJ20445.1 transcriptional regulator, TetR family [Malonomonas rubra DSM 5091]
MSKYQTSNKTQLALIEAAGELAAEKGFGTVTTRAIADRAGENIGSIHYHFGGRDQLLEAVLRYVAQDWIDNPLDQYIADCDLAEKTGQAEALRRAVVRFADMLFDDEKPEWHSRAVYQVLQYPSPLHDIFREIIMNREHEQVEQLLLKIDSDLSKEMLVLHFNLLLSPLITHSDYRGAILPRLNQPTYSREYLQALVDQCVEQSLLRYRLPLD